MIRPCLLPVFLWSLLLVSVFATSEVAQDQLSRTQLVLNIDREFKPTSVTLDIPLLAWGEMTLEAFAKRFDDPLDATLVRFLNAVRTGEGAVGALVEQGKRFEISDEAAFREGVKRRFFAPGSELRVLGVVPISQGKSYVLAVLRNGARHRVAILSVVLKDGGDGVPRVQMSSDEPLITLLEESLQSPLAAQEVAKNETGVKIVEADPWNHVRPVMMKPGEDPAFSAALKELISRIERSRFSEAMMPATRTYLSLSLERATKEERRRKIAQWVAPLKAAKTVLRFDPVFVILPQEREAPPVVLLDQGEAGLRLANVGRKNAFEQLLRLLALYPPQAPAAPEAQNAETAPH